MTPWNPPSRHFRAIVFLALTALALLIGLAAIFPGRIDDAPALIRSCAVVFVLVLLVAGASRRLPVRFRVALRAAGGIALVSFLFGAVAGVQHLLFDGWFDDAVIRFETAVTGIELSIWLERFIQPALTEWMMLSYVIYIPLLPFTAWVCYRYAGEQAVYEYIFALMGVNLLCDAGFVLFPVASQLFHDPAQYSVALTGGPFTAAAEWIRKTQHFPGGSLPSPHNAAGTVMLLTLWRHHRGWGLAFLPLLVSILPSTVYGRFHYISDGLIGIALGVAVVALARAMRPAPSATASAAPAAATSACCCTGAAASPPFSSLHLKSWRIS